jgi:4-hydroxy-3-polyprenylbenzoate decarboxylase
MTPAGRQTIEIETDWTAADVDALADRTYRIGDIAATISSGSYRVDAMVVIPCSMGTLSAIALSSSNNLLERAADVCLKERRRLVLCPREAPLHLGHLRLMTQVTEMGAIVFPPAPGFYSRPKSMEQLIDHTTGRVIDTLGIRLDHDLAPRWGGPEEHRAARKRRGAIPGTAGETREVRSGD